MKVDKAIAQALSNLEAITDGPGIRSVIILITDTQGVVSQQVATMPEDALQMLGSLEVVKASLTSYFLQQNRPLGGLN